MQVRNLITKKPIFVLVSAMLLSGCQIWPDYLRPKVEVPAQFIEQAQQSATESQITSNWWTLYQDPVLNELVDKALVSNKDIRL
ncbi:MAG: hypothetical protein B7X97_08470, partial [Methylotenera sp. 17-45-7]